MIDLAQFLVGEPASVSASLRTLTIERLGGTIDVDDAFAASVEFESGVIGTPEATRVALGRKNHMAFEINRSKGSLAFNLERLNELQVRGRRPRRLHRCTCHRHPVHAVLVADRPHHQLGAYVRSRDGPTVQRHRQQPRHRAVRRHLGRRLSRSVIWDAIVASARQRANVSIKY